MSIKQIVQDIVAGNSSDASDAIVAELDQRASSLVTDYRKACIADLFGGVVVGEEKMKMKEEDDDMEDDKPEGDDKETKKDDKEDDKPEDDDKEDKEGDE